MSTQQQSRHAHSKSSDSSSSSSAGSSYQLILDHVLTYPASYEIPLRTMYTLNCAPRSRHPSGSGSSSASSSPIQAHGGWQDSRGTQDFTESLMAQMSQLPVQPTSLPPSFITSFVRRCFPADLVLVDFPQALTGLDYLKDLETRRRREVAGAMSRLEIDKSTLDDDAASLSATYPGVLQWIKSIEEKERKVEALYTQLYVALRRWILINELSLLPYNKHNCVAMLNTLYPPVVSTPPTSKLTPPVLKGQRDGFFKYIVSVEKNGPRVLSNLIAQGKASDEEDGWLSVTRTLGLYLQLANSIISECADICDMEDVSPQKTRAPGTARTARKVDSGISFGSERPSTRSNSSGEPTSPTRASRAKTPPGSKSSTALEKLARGLKTIGRGRAEVTEMVTDEPPPSPKPEKVKTMRKMRSMDFRKSPASTPKIEGSNTFDKEAMRAQRKKFDAST